MNFVIFYLKTFSNFLYTFDVMKILYSNCFLKASCSFLFENSTPQTQSWHESVDSIDNKIEENRKKYYQELATLKNAINEDLDNLEMPSPEQPSAENGYLYGILESHFGAQKTFKILQLLTLKGFNVDNIPQGTRVHIKQEGNRTVFVTRSKNGIDRKIPLTAPLPDSSSLGPVSPLKNDSNIPALNNILFPNNQNIEPENRPPLKTRDVLRQEQEEEHRQKIPKLLASFQTYIDQNIYLHYPTTTPFEKIITFDNPQNFLTELQQAFSILKLPHNFDALNGEKFTHAIRTFQEQNGLTVDGLLGPNSTHTLLKRLQEYNEVLVKKHKEETARQEAERQRAIEEAKKEESTTLLPKEDIDLQKLPDTEKRKRFLEYFKNEEYQLLTQISENFDLSRENPDQNEELNKKNKDIIKSIENMYKDLSYLQSTPTINLELINYSSMKNFYSQFALPNHNFLYFADPEGGGTEIKVDTPTEVEEDPFAKIERLNNELKQESENLNQLNKEITDINPDPLIGDAMRAVDAQNKLNAANQTINQLNTDIETHTNALEGLATLTEDINNAKAKMDGLQTLKDADIFENVKNGEIGLTQEDIDLYFADKPAIQEYFDKVTDLQANKDQLSELQGKLSDAMTNQTTSQAELDGMNNDIKNLQAKIDQNEIDLNALSTQAKNILENDYAEAMEDYKRINENANLNDVFTPAYKEYSANLAEFIDLTQQRNSAPLDEAQEQRLAELPSLMQQNLKTIQESLNAIDSYDSWAFNTLGIDLSNRDNFDLNLKNINDYTLAEQGTYFADKNARLENIESEITEMRSKKLEAAQGVLQSETVQNLAEEKKTEEKEIQDLTENITKIETGEDFAEAKTKLEDLTKTIGELQTQLTKNTTQGEKLTEDIADNRRDMKKLLQDQYKLAENTHEDLLAKNNENLAEKTRLEGLIATAQSTLDALTTEMQTYEQTIAEFQNKLNAREPQPSLTSDTEELPR